MTAHWQVFQSVRGWFSRWKWQLLTIGTVAGLVYGSVLVEVGMSFGGNATLPADCGMVFGAAVHAVIGADGTIMGDVSGPGIRRRVRTAADLYKKGQIQKLFMSGGKGNASQASEAEIMRAEALKMGVPASRIVTEDLSRSTWENLKNTRPLTAGCKTVIGISDRYHLARIRQLATQQGWRVLEIYPASTHAAPYFELRSILREGVGMVWYGLFGFLYT
ncbi:MAG: hypothetical protein JWM56_1357 [Candidatus Peribacteria bacterium]|nr:hypothetical protein [Candidatus Peribacteria bacterium]